MKSNVKYDDVYAMLAEHLKNILPTSIQYSNTIGFSSSPFGPDHGFLDEMDGEEEFFEDSNEDFRDAFQKYPEKKCICSKEKFGFTRHATWCPLFEKFHV